MSDDLRAALATGFESVEEVPEAIPVAPTTQDEPVVSEVSQESRSRDELGRFAPKTESAPSLQDVPKSEVVPESPPPITRPSTWKKELWPLYDKLASGQTLTADESKRVADYTNERENQFKTGVSTYKAEAENARSLQTALAPFLPELQRHNIDPGQWIANLGRAHQVLAQGSPQEKLVMFQRLATEYQIPLNLLVNQEGQVSQPQVDPQVQWLVNKLGVVENQVQGFLTAQQQAEQAQIQQEIQRFASDPKNAHFEAVKPQMVQLLDSKMAQNLQEAYAKAIWLNDEVRDQLQQQKVTQSTQQAQQAVAKAKAAAVSPKSSSPSAPSTTPSKGLRDTISAQIDAALGGGRV